MLDSFKAARATSRTSSTRYYKALAQEPQMLDWFKAAGREPGGFYRYYKALAQEPQTQLPEPLSLKAKRLGLLLR